MPPSSAGGGVTVLDREFSASSLSGLRAAVLESASAAGLHDDRAIDVMLAMHELAANVIRHGAGRGRLLMEVTPGALRCQVSDTDSAGTGSAGTGSAPGDVAGGLTLDGLAAGSAPAASWPVEHGHGLWLVRLTADRVQVSSGPAGSVVSVVFTLPGALADR